MTLPRHRLCRGLLLVFEGVDGAGKTTQIRLLAERLQGAGYDVICLKEPTEGPWGQKLRQLARHGRQGISPSMELDWFTQDRRENVEHNIRDVPIGDNDSFHRSDTSQHHTVAARRDPYELERAVGL